MDKDSIVELTYEQLAAIMADCAYMGQQFPVVELKHLLEYIVKRFENET